MANVDASEDVTVVAREEATMVARPLRDLDESHARRDALLLGVLALAAYWLSNDGQFMFFNYHLHLAVSFLNGRLYIANPPSWLTEFAYADGKPYVYFDPFPAVFLLPQKPPAPDMNIHPLFKIDRHGAGRTGFTYSRASRSANNGTFFTFRTPRDVFEAPNRILKWQVDFD